MSEDMLIGFGVGLMVGTIIFQITILTAGSCS
jgi:hypothetical protein